MYHPLAHFQTTEPLFLDLRYNLDAEIIAGNVVAQSHPDYPELWLYNYTRECGFSKNWNTITKSSRGLILDHDAKRIVAFSMPKFFNLGEGDTTYSHVLNMLEKDDCRIYEKYDGSCGIAFWYNEQWHVATRGSFVSEQASLATEMLREYQRTHDKREGALIPGTTYIFEIIYPDNRIVVKYPFSGLVCLCAYGDSGRYIPPEDSGISSTTLDLNTIGTWFSYKVFNAVPEQSVSLDTLIETSKKLSLESEGFVIHSSTGDKVKIKGEEYCRVHRLVSRITPIGVWEVLVEAMEYATQSDEQGNLTWESAKLSAKLEEYKVSIPEEFWIDIDNITGILIVHAQNILKLNFHLYEQGQKLNRKEYAQYVMSCSENNILGKDVIPAIMFMYYDQKNLGAMFKIILKNLRPIGNKLEGYTPSTVTNRFATQEE